MKKEYLKIATIFIVTVAIVFWTLNFIFFKGNAPKSKATSEMMALSFTPTATSMEVNHEKTVIIKVKPSANMTVVGYLFEITFDKTKIEIKEVNYQAGSVSVNLGQDNGGLSIINSTGKLKIQGEINLPGGKILPVDSEENIVTLKFKLLKTGETNLAVDKNSVNFYRILSDMSLTEVPGNNNSVFIIN